MLKSGHIFDTYQEFILFLFIHLASADYSFKANEIEVILNKMEDYFPEVDDTDSLYNIFINLKDEYEDLNDEEINQIIFDNYHKHKNEGGSKDRILIDLHEIISADGYIHEQETRVLEHLKSLLKL